MTSPAGPEGRRRGRPATGKRPVDEPPAPERILTSARTEFAARGYDNASIRAIARGAHVDPALVHHYFGTKEQVFEAAVETAFAPAMAAPDIVGRAAGPDTGERLTRFFLGLWENPATREPLLAIVRSAVNNETAARIFRGMITRSVLARFAAGLDAPDARLRVELAAAQLVGVVMLRYVIKAEPIASEPAETLVTRLAPVVQHHLTAG